MEKAHIYKSLFDNIPVGYYRTTSDGNIIEVNDLLIQMLGYPDKESLLSVLATDIFVEPRTRAQENDSLAEKGMLRGYEIQLRTYGGSTIWVEDHVRAVKSSTGQIRYYEGVLIDIRDRKQLETQRFIGGKFELLKMLMDGISHDFSNLLTIITGNVTLIKKVLLQDPKVLRPLVRIEKACLDMTDLINQFSKISVAQESVKPKENLEKIVFECLAAIRDNGVPVYDIRIPQGIWPVRCSREDLNQVILSLVLNSSDALEAKEGGRIRIEAANVQVEESRGLLPREGEYVKLMIRDNGEGISPENLGRIFDPYFSTRLRVTDKGLGLGLAIAQALVKKYGGEIEVNSCLGEGTEATAYFPRA